MIKITNLSFKYEEKFVLNGVNLEIEKGSFTAIIGANGSGKSTLVKHFNSLLLPTKGNIDIDGLDTKKNQSEIRKKVGFVFQNFEDQLVYPIVEEDIAFGLENLSWKSEEIKKTIEQTLEQLRIKKLRQENINNLSFGQKQLVALAGVLAMQPEYIVFDEPTTMLDSANKKNIMQVIYDLNKKNNMTIIMVTNVLGDLKFAENVVVLKKGGVIFSGKKKLLNKKILLGAGLYV